MTDGEGGREKSDGHIYTFIPTYGMPAPTILSIAASPYLLVSVLT